MISDHISDDIPPHLKILKKAIPFKCTFAICLKLKHCKLNEVACHPTKWDVINDINRGSYKSDHFI